MVSVTKAASDTRLRQRKSTSLLLPVDHISSKNSNNISSRNNLINTHFPIANIQRGISSNFHLNVHVYFFSKIRQ